MSPTRMEEPQLAVSVNTSQKLAAVDTHTLRPNDKLTHPTPSPGSPATTTSPPHAMALARDPAPPRSTDETLYWKRLGAARPNFMPAAHGAVPMPNRHCHMWQLRVIALWRRPIDSLCKLAASRPPRFWQAAWSTPA